MRTQKMVKACVVLYLNVYQTQAFVNNYFVNSKVMAKSWQSRGKVVAFYGTPNRLLERFFERASTLHRQ